MKLINHIIYGLLVPLGIGMFLLSLIMVAMIYTQSGGWISSIQNILELDEINAFQSMAISRAKVVEAIMSGFQVDIVLASTYAVELFRNDSSNLVPLNVSKPYVSYFGAQVGNPPTDPAQPPLNEQAFFSTYFNVNITTAAELDTPIDTETKSTVLDNVLRALSLNKPTTQNVYMGFEDFGFRRYPYLFNDVYSQQLRNKNVCNSSSTPSNLYGRSGFIPACRPWYQQAVSASMTSSMNNGSNGLGPFQIAAPYTDLSTQRVITTASQAIFTSTGLLGVMGIDIDIEELNQALTKTPVLTNGYMFMMDNNGTLIIYPPVNSSGSPVDIYSSPTTVTYTEFGGNLQQGASFLALALRVANTEISDVYIKGGMEWRVAAALVNGTDYIVCVVVPSSDIQAFGTQMHSQAVIFGGIATAVVVILLAALIFVAYIVSLRTARRILDPIADLNKMLTKMCRVDFAEELRYKKMSVSTELNHIHVNFQTLLVAVQLGNEAYYAGDNQRALASYKTAEKMMEELENERGRGVCLNNQGNVYKQIGDFDQALKAYELAIVSAKKLMDMSEGDQHDACEIILANRYMNLGVLYMDVDPRTEQSRATAESYLEQSRNLHSKHNNVQGIAQVSGNLGQLYLADNQVEDAATLIKESYEIAKKSENEISIQYAAMNMGVLALAGPKPKPDEALAWFVYVLQRFDTVVAYVQKRCLDEAIRLCKSPEINRSSLATSLQQYREEMYGGSQYRIVPKDIAFVLDVSGSMDDWIQSCRDSLIDIIKNYTFEGDNLSLTTFNDNYKVVWPSKPRNVEEMVRSVEMITETDGQTAFWHALLQAIRELGAYSTSLQKSYSSQSRALWIVALTDGMDNKSPKNSMTEVYNELSKYSQISLLVITVGSLENEPEIKRACEASRDGGLLVESGTDDKAIKDAFVKVAEFMKNQSQVVVDNLYGVIE